MLLIEVLLFPVDLEIPDSLTAVANIIVVVSVREYIAAAVAVLFGSCGIGSCKTFFCFEFNYFNCSF